MIGPLRRIRNAYGRHGFYEFVRLALYNMRYHVWIFGRKRPKDFAPDALDEMLGTDTAGIREVGSLIVTSTNVRHGVRYQPSDSAIVKNTIDGLSINYSDFSFIDFGSGKGRVVLLAASYPFKAIIGIEYSQELHDIALNNVARVPSSFGDTSKIALICCDAMEYQLPSTDLICYFYNPFDLAVLAPIAQRLVAHSHVHGHRVIVIYVDPEHRAAFEETGSFQLKKDKPPVLVLSTYARPHVRLSTGRPVSQYTGNETRVAPDTRTGPLASQKPENSRHPTARLSRHR